MLFVVVKADNKNFAFDSANIDICGKKMLDWVLIAGSGCESLVLANEGEDLLKTLKSIKTDKKFMHFLISRPAHSLQICISHQILIGLFCNTPAFTYTPYNK